ncbi:Membrane-associated guanylate kinase, WW and PDZ domain-containing protein 3 [Sparganum proliferum]
MELLDYCLRTYFTLNGQIYEQIQGAPMGSPISGYLAEAVLQELETRVFQTYKPKFWMRYVDDTFVILHRDAKDNFKRELDSVFPQIQFTMEEETNGVLSFLDVQATDTEKILHYSSNHPLSHKRSCVRTLFHRIHTHCSTEAEKLRERKTLWHLFLANGYPRSFVNKCLYRRHTKTDGEEKQRPEIFRVLPYVRNVSEATERMLRPLSVGVGHRPEATIRRLIMQPKDRLPPADTSGVIYRVKCLDCPANYCGMADKRLRTRMHEHTLAVRRKDVRSHVAMHCPENNHTFDFDGAQVIGRAESKLAREVIEAWKSDTNSINRSIDLPAPGLFQRNEPKAVMPRTALHTPTTQHAMFTEERQTVPTRLLLGTCKSWESSVYEVLLSAAPPDKFLSIPIEGGSDCGRFCVVGPEVNPSRLVYHPILSGPKKTASILRPGDVILEIGDYQVSGYTKLDALKVCEALSYCEELTNRPRVLMKLIPLSSLPNSDSRLGPFLSASFTVGSPEYLLQEVTRDNIYQRVVPCTTRAPRHDEVNGVHYQFMGVEQFLALEKAGRLLESGTYKGNYYGTPQPDPTSSALDPELLNRKTASQNGSAPAEASAAVRPVNGEKSSGTTTNCQSVELPATVGPPKTSDSSPPLAEGKTENASADGGPLLPPGWEVINHPEYGTFYIDHVHRKTQYEPPTAADFEEAANLSTAAAHLVSNEQAAAATASAAQPDTTGSPSPSVASSSRQSSSRQNVDSSPVTVLRTPSLNSGRSSSSSSSQQCRCRPDVFTSDISKLRGPLVTTTLTKSPRGFGFTIIGGSSPTQPGFLQIKNIIPGGPAALNGVLAIGDVLVSVNGVNVLGFSHDEIVSLFQSIQVDSSVTLVVSQGYALCKSPMDVTAKPSQIKNIIPGGPAALNGVLAIGDVLVSVNGVNVLGFSHDEIVSLFQSIQVDSSVTLVVSQGYALCKSPMDVTAKPSQVVSLTPKGRLAAPETVSSSSADRVPFAPPELCIRRLNTSPTISQSSGEPVRLHESARLPPNQRLEFIKVSIVKQQSGFGFTLADQPQGQRVKEVLDPARCDGLKVGDIVVEINDQRVKELSHLEVVQLLKTCPVGKTTRFLVQRSHYTLSDLDRTGMGLGAAFTHLPDCSSLDSGDSPGKTFSPLTPFARPSDLSTMQSSLTASTVRFRSRTPGPDDHRSLRSSTLGNSSDCIYSLLGDSLSGLNLLSPQSPRRRYPYNDRLAGNWPHPKQQQQIPSDHLDAVDFYGRMGAYPTNNYPGGYLFAQPANYGSLLRSGKMLPRQFPPIQAPAKLRATSPADPSMTNSTVLGSTLPGEFLVRLRRRSDGLGFKLLGGAEEGTPLSIGPLVPGGVAEKSGMIQTGDHLVSVNGERVVGARHRRVVQLLEQAAACTYSEVILGLWRPTEAAQKFWPPPSNVRQHSDGGFSVEQQSSTSSSSSIVSGARQVVLRRSTVDEGFGFVIAHSLPPGVPAADGDQAKAKLLGQYIARLVPGSPAERSRQLQVGDLVLSINGVSIAGLRREDIVRLIRDSGCQVSLSVLPHSTPTAHYENHIAAKKDYVHQQQQQQQHHHQQFGPPLPSLPLPMTSSVPALLFEITLFRSSRGFGFSIRGGHEFNQMPLTVLRIAEGGSAFLDGRLRVGDELVQINGHFTAGMSHRRAVEIIQAGGNMIRLVNSRIPLAFPQLVCKCGNLFCKYTGDPLGDAGAASGQLTREYNCSQCSLTAHAWADSNEGLHLKADVCERNHHSTRWSSSGRSDNSNDPVNPSHPSRQFSAGGDFNFTSHIHL